jgi:uncharacterized membrane protein YfcA
MADYAILALTGLIAGILGSIVGVGGGMIIMPVLNIALGFSPELTIGTSLFAIVFTSLSSAIGHYRIGNIDMKLALKVGAGGIFGVLIGSYIFSGFLAGSMTLLRVIMGLWFMFLSLRMGQQAYQSWRSASSHTLVKEETRKPLFSADSTGMLFLVGCFVGILSGILGIGGGVVMVPALLFLFGLPPHWAVGTTFMVMLPTALAGGLIKLFQGFVVLDAGILLGIGTTVGAQLGIWFSRLLTPLMLKILFCGVFFVVSLSYLF